MWHILCWKYKTYSCNFQLLILQSRTQIWDRNILLKQYTLNLKNKMFINLKKQLPGPLKHLCTSVTLICSKVYCPLLMHLLSSHFLSSLSSVHPTTKDSDDPSVLLFLSPSPPSGCFLFQNPLRDKPPAVLMGEGMKGDAFWVFLPRADNLEKMWPWFHALLKK